MSVFTAFAIGTGHTRAEASTLMVRLYDACDAIDAVHLGTKVDQIKYILDGVGASYDARSGEVSKSLFAQATGWGLREKTDEVVAHIERLRPRVVNLTGHSRGAIICVRIAARLAETLPDIKCNLFLVDPVKTSLLGGAADSASTYANVALFRQIIMENESKFIFDPTRIRHHGGAASNTIHMPGTHGTATQTGQPVGMIAHMLAVNFLALCGSAMNERHFSPQQLADAYSRITLANPVKRTGSGTGRAFQDLDAGKGFSFSLGGMRDLMGFGRENAWKDDAYFVNNDHAQHFGAAWPEAFMVLTGKGASAAGMGRLTRELRQMRSQAPRAWRTLPPSLREVRV